MVQRVVVLVRVISSESLGRGFVFDGYEVIQMCGEECFGLAVEVKSTTGKSSCDCELDSTH